MGMHLFCAGVLLASLGASAEDAEPMQVTGDSLVLAHSVPGMLCFRAVDPASVVVRSTYAANAADTVVYAAGKDYVVDGTAGTIARTADSRIPDFSTNSLYGQRDFDHTRFPGFGNRGFIVYVDYRTTAGFPLFTESDQSALLERTARKLGGGGAFKLIAFGDSITEGADVSSVNLRYQQRYAAHLRERFPKARITVENGATGGDSTRDGLARLEEKVLTRSPDLVLLAFGMNDHNIGGVPVDVFEDNLVSMARQIGDRTSAEVIMLSAFPPNPDWKFGSHRMDQYAAATKRAAERARCAFADVYGTWMKVLNRKTPSSMLVNNINHPNDFGHWIYGGVLEGIRF